MTYQLRALHRLGRRPWHAGSCAALLAALGTMAGSLAASAPAFADGTTTTTAVTVSTTASAATSARLDRVKRDSNRLIERRIGSLQRAAKVVASKSFLGADQATLSTELNTDIAGLQALDAKIQADTTLQQALADRADIFSSFRVYLLVLPVVNLVIKIDYIDNVALTGLNQDITQLQGYINSSNQAVLQPLVSDMQNQVSIATSATAGVNAQLMGYTAANWDANHKVLSNAYLDVRTSDKAIMQANVDLKKADHYLGRGLGAGHHNKH